MRSFVAAAIFLLAALPSYGSCPPFFTYTTPVLTGQDPQSIATADFNKDGFPDIVTPSSTMNNVSVFLGIGDGTFPVSVPTYAVGSGPTIVRSAEFSADTWPDIVTLDTTGNTVSVLLNNQDGTFAAAVTTATGITGPVQLEAGDINGDGKADVAIAGATQIIILYGLGDGHFSGTTTTLATAGAPQDLDLADFDGDNKLDVVDTADAPSMLTKLEVWHNELPTGFTRTTYNPPNALSYRVMAGDLTLDGKPDVTMTTNLGVVIYLNNGSGALTFKQTIGGDYVNHREMTLADVSEDGIPDIILSGIINDIARFLWINPDGSVGFSTRNTLEDGTAVVAADFNHDGRPDFAEVRPGSNHFWVALNACNSRYVTIEVHSSANPSFYTDAVTFTITVTPREPFMAVPTGTVSITNGPGPVALTPGGGGNWATAMITVSSGMHIGTNNLSVNYNGDAMYGAKNVGFVQTVNRRPFSTPLDFSIFNVSLKWTNSADVDHTEIWRLDGGVWSLLDTTTSEVYTDSTAVNTKTYGYRVRSVAAGGGMTAFTYILIGTTNNFGLLPTTGSLILASHITTPRDAVNQLRVTAGLPTLTYTDPNVFGVFVKAIHINEMRNGLDLARSTIGLPAWPYVHPTITGGGVSTVFAIDFRELKDGATKR